MGAIPGRGADLDKSRAHLFHLTDARASRCDGGTIQQANEHSFPILYGQAASVVLTRLEPGGIREPHWHPRNSITSSRGRGEVDGRRAAELSRALPGKAG